MCVCLCVYAMEYYRVITKDEILLFAVTWTDPEGITLSEISQKIKRQIPYSCVYGT